jgi:CheY-like chemotaxis protein
MSIQTAPAEDNALEDFVLFKVVDLLFGINILDVQEIKKLTIQKSFLSIIITNINELIGILVQNVVFRSHLIDAFSAFSDVRVVGFAADGKSGLEKIQQMKPDLVTLDIEMPVLNGIETLRIIKQDFPSIQVIMVSSFTRGGSIALM